jgi:hypothetical protein
MSWRQGAIDLPKWRRKAVLPLSFALPVKVDFLLQNSLILRHLQRRKFFRSKALGCRTCCNMS